MRRMRTGLLLALAAALLAASPLSAQVAPTLTGETGLFELYDAQTVPHGPLLVLALLQHVRPDRRAGARTSAPQPDDPLRYSTDKLGMTMAFGLLPNWEASFSAGQRYYSADDRLWAGNINGRNRYGEIDHDETDKFRIGTKVSSTRRTPEGRRSSAPSTSRRRAGTTTDALSDLPLRLGLGLLGHLRDLHRPVRLPLDRATAATTATSSTSRTRCAGRAGVGIPIIPTRSTGSPRSTGRCTTAARPSRPTSPTPSSAPGSASATAASSPSAGVRANIDRWVKYGSSPSNIGGIVQLSWTPQPAKAAEAPKVVPSPHEPPPRRAGAGPAGPVAAARPGPRRRGPARPEARDVDDRRDPLRRRRRAA